MRIIAKNFLSWKELEFDITDGVTLIDGWNHDDNTSEGSGKSAVVNALCFGLFGKLPKDAKVDEVIRQGEKSCEINIITPEFTIVRTRKPNEIFVEHKDRGRIKGKDAKETQKIIEEMLGFSYETFMQTIYFAQNYGKKFITSTQEDKGRILSEVQDLQLFDRARVEAQERQRDVRQRLAQDESGLLSYEKDIRHVKEKITMLKTQSERETFQVSQRIRKAEKQVKEYTKQAKEFKKVNINRLQKVVDKLDKQLDKITDAHDEYNTAMYDKNRLRKDVDGLKDIIDNPHKDCPTCGTILETRETKEIERKWLYLREELQEFPMPHKPQDQKELRKEISRLHREMREGERNNGNEKVITTKLKYALSEIEEAKAIKIEDVSHDVEALSEHVFDLIREKQSLCDQIKESRSADHRLETLKRGFKEIKSFVFNSALLDLTNKTNTYLTELFDVPIQIMFTNENMKIGMDVVFDGKPRGLGLLSGGQFRRVSLAVDLALSDIINIRKGSKFNLLILDEYFKDLSEQSMEKCLKLLERLGKSTILIEHNSIFKSIVDKTFEVELRGGVSSVTSS